MVLAGATGGRRKGGARAPHRFSPHCQAVASHSQGSEILNFHLTFQTVLKVFLPR